LWSQHLLKPTRETTVMASSNRSQKKSQRMPKKNESPYGIIEPFKESEEDPEKPDTGYDNLDYNDKATDADPNQEPSGGDTTTVEQEDECSYGVIEPFKVNDEDVIPQDEDHESYGVVDQFTTPSETVTQKDFSQTHVVAEGNSSLYLGMDPDAPTTAPQRRTDPDSYHQVSPDASEPVEAPVPVFTGDDITNFVALFPYQATNFDELDVITGHRLCITEVWPDGWAFGKNLDTDKIGIIPGNFLGPAEISLGCPEPSKPDVLTEFPDRYTMVEPDQVQRMTDPTSYQQLTPEGDDVTPPLPEFTGDNKPNYKCSFEFKGSNFDELDSAAGDTLCITEIWPDGWTFGKNLETNKIGIIPGNFVVPIQAVDGVGASEITQPDVLTEFPDRYSVVEPSLAQ